MRTITAPGVEIKEIDKSQYSPSMVGTACYVAGFANKGEAYQPMEFTSRAAWTTYYGEPDNEAERYFYNACTEVLNQNGRLYCARLPYDNQSFEKMTAFKYTVGKDAQTFEQIAQQYRNPADPDFSWYQQLSAVDKNIEKATVIKSSGTPYLMDLSQVDLYRTDEAKVASDTFVILDKTCGTYKKIQEDSRKGQDRELLGIMPVVTTALNALYAQKLISVDNRFAKYYESCGYVNTQLSGNVGIYSSNVRTELNNIAVNEDLVRQLNSIYKKYRIRQPKLVPNSDDLKQKNVTLNAALMTGNYTDTMCVSTLISSDISAQQWCLQINDYVSQLTAEWKKAPDLSSMTKTVDLNALCCGTEVIEQGAVVDLDISQVSIGHLRGSITTLIEYYKTLTDYHAEDGDDTLPDTVSFEANSFFPTVTYNTDTESFDSENLKKIGVVVYKVFIDPSAGNKVSFEPVEAFAGSLYKDDKDINTGITTFIDTIINNQSDYIYFFSNCFNTPATKKIYLGNDPQNKIDILLAAPTHDCGSLGFFEKQVAEDISISKSIFDGLNKCFDKVANINDLDIDIIPDAGLANIASFIKAIYSESGKYDLAATDTEGNSLISLWKATDLTSGNGCVKTWKSVELLFDKFCKRRKDCMFIADGLRPMVIQGQKKIVRPSNPKNTIDVNILPYVKYQTGLNTSYGAGYMDWFEIADEYTGNLFWCPPSIKAMGSYIYTDTNFNYWDAPAGLTRGIIAATDVAFNPTPAQAGAIYEKNWNYAINYPNDGIILEGQKTFQVKPTAFDRVNVRRLFLRLERAAYKVARYFVYEGNTAYTRQRLVDALDPYFKEAKVGGGVYDYKIICDESINTPEVIDRNELKVKIGIKPVKTAEFILIDFIALTTGGSFEEAMA